MTKMNRRNSKKILDLLKENPNIQRACKKSGIVRSTLYRWMGNDIDFRNEVRDAQEIGQDTMNDFVEAKLIENINSGNPRSIEFYLRHNNPKYASNRTESDYFSKRALARVASMPAGTDQMYYEAEISMYEKAIEILQTRQMIADLTYDPKAPVLPESLGPDFAREFYTAFPDAKEKIQERQDKYNKKKKSES